METYIDEERNIEFTYIKKELGIIQNINVGLNWTEIEVKCIDFTEKISAKTGDFFSLLHHSNFEFQNELIGKSIIIDTDEHGYHHWHRFLKIN